MKIFHRLISSRVRDHALNCFDFDFLLFFVLGWIELILVLQAHDGPRFFEMYLAARNQKCFKLPFCLYNKKFSFHYQMRGAVLHLHVPAAIFDQQKQIAALTSKLSLNPSDCSTQNGKPKNQMLLYNSSNCILVLFCHDFLPFHLLSLQCFCLFFSSLFFPRVLRCYLVSTGMISILRNDCNDDDNGEDVTNSALLLVWLWDIFFVVTQRRAMRCKRWWLSVFAQILVSF